MNHKAIPKVALLLFISPLISCQDGDKEYLCFSSPDYSEQRLCYLLGLDPEKTAAARNALISLANDIHTDPAVHLRVSDEMLRHRSTEEWTDSFKKHYSWLTSDSISHLITRGAYTAVFLNDSKYGNATLYYSHSANAFELSYDSPIMFQGANNYYGRGYQPVRSALEIPDSNCNLARDDIIFLSPPRDRLVYKEETTFCEYHGMYFAKHESGMDVRRVDQMNLHYSLISNVDFKNFLLWLIDG